MSKEAKSKHDLNSCVLQIKIWKSGKDVTNTAVFQKYDYSGLSVIDSSVSIKDKDTQLWMFMSYQL